MGISVASMGGCIMAAGGRVRLHWYVYVWEDDERIGIRRNFYFCLVFMDWCAIMLFNIMDNNFLLGGEG